jgi:hypothetical protein
MKPESNILLGMHDQMMKLGSSKVPDLMQASEALQGALEIFEQAGLSRQADQVLQVLEKLGRGFTPQRPTTFEPTVRDLMEAGITQREINEAKRGNLLVRAKIEAIIEKLATKAPSSARQIANLKNHGTVFNMVDDVPPYKSSDQLTADDMDADFVGLLDSPAFDMDSSDDDLLLNQEVDDSLEAFEKDIPMTDVGASDDFEDEEDR